MWLEFFGKKQYLLRLCLDWLALLYENKKMDMAKEGCSACGKANKHEKVCATLCLAEAELANGCQLECS